MPAATADQQQPAEDRDALWALVERTQAGDTRAFGDLYDHTVKVVFRFIMLRTGDRHTAEDLTSDVYLRALANIDRLRRTESSPAAWLVTIARNLIADHYKLARVRTTTLVAEISDADVTPARDRQCDGGHPQSETLAYLAGLDLWEAVKQLTPEQYDVVVARFLSGLSVEETARVVGRQAGAVKALQYRAVRALANDKRVVALAAA